MPLGHWLVKSEPFKYAWDQLVEDGRTEWDGVRNYEARNNLRDMKVGDLVLYYHSNEGKEVVGVARVCGEAYPDPTTDDDRWVAVDVEPVQRLEEPVTLAAIKAEPALSEIALVRRGRISVVPITPGEFARILAMGQTALRPDARPEKLPPRPAPPRNTGARKAAAAKATGAAKRPGTRKAGAKAHPKKTAARKKSRAKKAGRKAPAKKKGAPARRRK
jgi:predicted RNA-binding protein with PUA-like domain